MLIIHHLIVIRKVIIKRFIFELFVNIKSVCLGFKSGRSQRMSQISARDPNIEEYWFFCQQWLDAGQGDRQTVRELLPTDENGRSLSNLQGKLIE